MFFKIDVLKIFAIFTEKHLSWPLQAFFYRTPTVAASRFSRQQILFPAESGIYCWRSHRFLLRTPFRNSHQRCSIEIGVLRNFTKFTGKHLCQSLFFNKVAAQTLAQVFSCEFCEIFKNILFTENFRVTASVKASYMFAMVLNNIQNCNCNHSVHHYHKIMEAFKFIFWK